MTNVVMMAAIDFVTSEDRDRWLAGADEFMASTNAEPGCRYHVVAADPQLPTRVLAQAHYESPDAFNAHVASDHTIRFGDLGRECGAHTQIERLIVRGVG